MHIIDVIIVLIYLVLCIFVALYKFKSIKIIREYAIGRGYFSNTVIITTLFVTNLNAASVLGGIEKVYTLGIFFIVVRLFSPLFWLIMAKICGENIDQFRGCISVSDIMALLYGKIGRWVTNTTSMLASIGVVAMQAAAMGHIANYCFGTAYHQSVIITVLILALYSSLGGIRAIAFTDVFQFAVIIVALPVAFSFAYHDVGGYRGIVNSLPDEMITLDINRDNAFSFWSLIICSILPRPTGVFVQRFFMSRDSIQLTYCLNVAAVISFFFAIIICMIGLILKIKEPDIEPHIVFIHFIIDHIAVGFKGLIIVGLLAVIMSTADSWLNTTSVLFTHDMIREVILLNERQALLVARIFTFLISIFAAFLALNQNGLIEIQFITANFWGPLMTIPLSVGFLKFRTNSKSFIAAAILAILSTSISGYIIGDFATISLMCGMIGSAIGLFGMHYLQVYLGTLNIHTLSIVTQPISLEVLKVKI
ncbi:sodium:solute symporter family protein [Candidatus Lariskella endosymbiont of Hedychridium roseum]|uniref:sodium:solute symporter family protein n=1 Tax=Candidatus Lariskella endosymbiont of Hedychridium roseum TaxID=3077949 RepID=UPI0030D09356